MPGAGAAGGLGAALLALGAELRSGVETVLDLIGFDERVRDVDLVITGEGNMDEQSAAGKAPGGRGPPCQSLGKPVVAVVGGRADNLDAVYGQGIDLSCRSAAGPCLLTKRSTPRKPQPTSSAPVKQPPKPTTSPASKTQLPISCGGIVPVWRLRRQKQELFHRNFENGYPRLVALGLGSDRPP